MYSYFSYFNNFLVRAFLNKIETKLLIQAYI